MTGPAAESSHVRAVTGLARTLEPFVGWNQVDAETAARAAAAYLGEAGLLASGGSGECPQHKWMGRVYGSTGACPHCELEAGGSGEAPAGPVAWRYRPTHGGKPTGAWSFTDEQERVERLRPGVREEWKDGQPKRVPEWEIEPLYADGEAPAGLTEALQRYDESITDEALQSFSMQGRANAIAAAGGQFIEEVRAALRGQGEGE